MVEILFKRLTFLRGGGNSFQAFGFFVNVVVESLFKRLGFLHSGG